MTRQALDPAGRDALRAWLARGAARLNRYAKLIGSVLFLFCSGSGFLALFAYLQAIGRPDLFMPSLSLGPALFAWLFAVALIALAALACLLAPSLILALFLAQRPSDEAARRLLASHAYRIVASGFALLLAAAWIIPLERVYWVFPLLFAWVSLATGLLCVGYPAFRRALGEPLAPRGHRVRGGDLLGFILSASAMLTLAVLAGVFPAAFAIDAYRGGDTDWDLLKALAICLVSMLLAATPTLAFHLTRGDTLRKLRHGALALGLCVALFFLLSLPFFGVLTYAAARVVHLRETEPSTYLISPRYPPSTFAGRGWRAQSRDEDGGRTRIEAFRQYRFGTMNLLCPAALREVRLRRWPDLSSTCLAIREADFTLLPVPETPPTPAVEGRPATGTCVSVRALTRPPRVLRQERVCLFAAPL
ncbi:hypothetical protein [Pseudomonas sp. RIT-PI-AD]|uniref:hypothetical protein n=1 Tax=Pseudomonas sp. RIT-PI-AD TaxID=3035294 RepID=UPI0021D8EE71|nr:hypothetical protein [Pseudomonas sp. RIT-PI-AD]